MVSVQVFVEGGARGNNGKRMIREALATFFIQALPNCREMQITPGGARGNTIDRFVIAFQHKFADVTLLLVDSEGPLPKGTSAYELLIRQGYHIPKAARQNCFLMVQCMESWLVAHKDGLAEYFGKGFKASNIPEPHDPDDPSRFDVEQIYKDEVIRSLKNARRHSEVGEYDKVQHGLDAKLWSKINPALVRQASRSCDQLIIRLHKLLC